MSKTTTSSSSTSNDEIRPVTDELTAMRGKLLDGYDEFKSYAIGLVQMESIVSIMARRQFHAFFLQEAFGVKHLIEKNTDPAVRALAILVIAADIAIGLLPAVARIDAKIKAESASSLEGLVRQRIDRHRVFERRLLAAYDLSDAEKTAYPPRLWPRQAIDPELDSQSGLSSVAGIPAIHGLGQPRSLAAFFETRLDLNHLVDQAVAEFIKYETWRWMSGAPHSLDHTILNRAAHCALLRGYSALATVGIWPARSAKDRQSKAKAQAIARYRSKDAPKFRAAVDLAHLYGEVLAPNGHD